MKKVEKRLCHEVLALFEVIDGDATQNILKRQYSLSFGSKFITILQMVKNYEGWRFKPSWFEKPL
jgi:hypothetical protein